VKKVRYWLIAVLEVLLLTLGGCTWLWEKPPSEPEVVIPPTTKVLDSETEARLVEITDDGRFIYSGSTHFFDALNHGDIVVCGVTPLTPFGRPGARIEIFSNKISDYEFSTAIGYRKLLAQATTISTATGQIAFASDRDGNGEIYVMNTDWSNQHNLTNHPAADWHPTWSPDGTRIAFCSVRDGNIEIYVMDGDGSNVRRLTNHIGLDQFPSWSPDGSHIAFVSNRDGNCGIYVMDADGANIRRLVQANAGLTEYQQPAWSPDGTRIAFDSHLDGLYEIYVVNSDGSNLRRLTYNPCTGSELEGGCDHAYDEQPTWAGDSARIAFISSRDGNWEIYVMNADGTDQHNLTNHPADDWEPAWSPDGTQIAFVSVRDGNHEIYVMDADGSNVRNLTNHPAHDGSPAWSPVLP